MKRALVLAFFFILATGAKPMNEPKDVVGPLTRSELERKNLDWLRSGETAESARLAKADPATRAKLASLARKMEGTEVEAYVASWCPDTQDQLPVFLSTLDAAKAKPKSLKFFALDKRKTYPGYTNPRLIERIPTFVFLKGGKEVGRFVETPKTSVLDDMLAMLP